MFLILFPAVSEEILRRVSTYISKVLSYNTSIEPMALVFILGYYFQLNHFMSSKLLFQNCGTCIVVFINILENCIPRLHYIIQKLYRCVHRLVYCIYKLHYHVIYWIIAFRICIISSGTFAHCIDQNIKKKNFGKTNFDFDNRFNHLV